MSAPAIGTQIQSRFSSQSLARITPRTHRRARISRAVSLTALGLGCSLLPSTVFAQYEVPNPTYDAGTYYNTINTASGTFKADLNNLIDGHTVWSYDDARTTLQVVDADPNTPGHVLLVYSGFSVTGTWDAGVTWNREHCWPDSYGPNGSGMDYSDMFNLRPCNNPVNSDRGNEFYDDVLPANRMVANVAAPECWEDNRYPDTQPSGDQRWEPRAVEKGDLARNAMYMDVRYDGVDANTVDFELVGTDNLGLITAGSRYMGNLDALLRWHYQDGISNVERKRNDQINDLYQHNRNPFVDHPEWVWKVFGGGNNNSKMYVSVSAPSDGASTATANLRVMKNGTWGTTNVTLTKSGANPTTYDVSAAGNATTTAAGVGQAFDYNGQSRALAVSLNASTATTGLKTGTVTIDNTDITTGGTGQGSADGNDVITVNGQVLDNRVITAGTAAFGRVIAGANVTTTTTLSSAGSDDSNTRVTVNGTASSADSNGAFITAGSPNTFNGTLTSANRTVQANFATAGLGKNGSRSFSVTGEGLTGETVNGVSVNYTADALNHALPSLASGSTVTAQTVDFGYVPAGFAARTSGFTVYNRPNGGGGVSLTAGLDIDGTTGASSQMTTNVVATNPLTPLAPNGSLAYTATYTPTTGGLADVVHAIQSSDENIPGASSLTNLQVTAKGHTVTTSAVFPTTGFMNLLTGETFNAGTFAINPGVTLTYNGVGTMNVNGAQSNGAGSSLVATSGVINLNTDAGPSSATLAINSSGTSSVNFGSSQHLASLTITGTTATATAASDKTISTSALSITGPGKLDLTRNKLIVHGGTIGTWNNVNYTGVSGLITSGRNGGNWNGPGLTTSMPDATSGSGYTSLGVALASEVRGIGASDTDTWGGQAVTGSDVLVMYTYGGDANLSGNVDVDDYGQIDFNASIGGVLTGWYNGDFDYNGVVDVDDYGVIDYVINIQGAPFPTGAGAGIAIASVPEPSALCGVALLTGALLRRRRRS